MRPEEMRAALVAWLANSAIDVLTCRKGFRHMVDDLDEETLTDLKEDIGESAATAVGAFLQQIGAKITVREPSEAMLSTEIDSEIPAHEYEPADPLMWPQRRWVWKCLYDAAPLTPWLKEDTHGEG